jgi:uncharacterized protein YozE (UPF0346 family)
MTPKKRYFVHGDIKNSGVDGFYCVSCDSFENREHFYEKSPHKNQYERYLLSLKRWKGSPGKNATQRLYLSEHVFQGYKPPNEATSKFYRWVKKQKIENNPLGDLFDDILRDKEFPRAQASLERVTSYIQFKSRHDAWVLAAFDEALKIYKGISKKTVARAAVSVSLRLEIFERDNFSCKLCGQSVIDGAKLEVDHIHPASKGGSNERANLRTLCFKCNRGKGARMLKRDGL